MDFDIVKKAIKRIFFVQICAVGGTPWLQSVVSFYPGVRWDNLGLFGFFALKRSYVLNFIQSSVESEISCA